MPTPISQLPGTVTPDLWGGATVSAGGAVNVPFNGGVAWNDVSTVGASLVVLTSSIDTSGSAQGYLFVEGLAPGYALGAGVRIYKDTGSSPPHLYLYDRATGNIFSGLDLSLAYTRFAPDQATGAFRVDQAAALGGPWTNKFTCPLPASYTPAIAADGRLTLFGPLAFSIVSQGAPPAPTLQSVAVGLAASTVAGGQTVQATATGTFSDGTSTTTRVLAAADGLTWSQPAGMGSIDGSGLSTAPAAAAGAQTVTVTASVGGKSGTASYTVPAAPPPPTAPTIRVRDGATGNQLASGAVLDLGMQAGRVPQTRCLFIDNGNSQSTDEALVGLAVVTPSGAAWLGTTIDYPNAAATVLLIAAPPATVPGTPYADAACQITSSVPGVAPFLFTVRGAVAAPDNGVAQLADIEARVQRIEATVLTLAANAGTIAQQATASAAATSAQLQTDGVPLTTGSAGSVVTQTQLALAPSITAATTAATTAGTKADAAKTSADTAASAAGAARDRALLLAIDPSGHVTTANPGGLTGGQDAALGALNTRITEARAGNLDAVPQLATGQQLTGARDAINGHTDNATQGLATAQGVTGVVGAARDTITAHTDSVTAGLATGPGLNTMRDAVNSHTDLTTTPLATGTQVGAAKASADAAKVSADAAAKPGDVTAARDAIAQTINTHTDNAVAPVAQAALGAQQSAAAAAAIDPGAPLAAPRPVAPGLPPAGATATLAQKIDAIYQYLCGEQDLGGTPDRATRTLRKTDGTAGGTLTYTSTPDGSLQVRRTA